MALAEFLLEQKAVGTRVPGAAVRTWKVRPDLLLADRESARLPLGRFVGIGGGNVGIDFVIARDLPGASGWTAQGPDLTDFLRLADTHGAWVAPPGAGDRRAFAIDAIASPGRLFATLGAAPGAGALGALAVPVGELEALTLLLGEPLEVEPGPARRIELTGDLPPRCDGHDVAGAIIAGHPGALRGAWIEFGGPGVAMLTIDDRIVIARALQAAGAGVVMFPSDERTREFLRGRGREPDWRRTEAGAPGADAWHVDLGWTVPHAISSRQPGRAVPLAWWSGVSVSGVEVGPGLSLEGLARFAGGLGERPVHDATAVRVIAPTARAATAPEVEPLASALESLGARWVREGEITPWKMREGALRLACGALPHSESPAEDDWGVGLIAAAEAACRGAIEDPHAWPDPRERAPIAAVSTPVAHLPAARTPGVAGAPAPRFRRSSPSPNLRGPVLGRMPGNLEADSLLPMGPRLLEHLANPERLAEFAVPSARPPGVHPPRPAGVWLLVVGEVRALERREAGLLALAALGVRAILATGVEPRARTLCARAGLLVLRTLRAADLESIEPGDELELVGGLETWAPDRARVVRDLTRGFAVVALPELSEREWNWVTAGGSAERGVTASC